MPLGASPWAQAGRQREADTEAGNTLAAWGLTLGQDVEVELLVGSGSAPAYGPRLVEGVIAGATGNVLTIETRPTARLTRVAWQAVATIRDRVTTHPGL
jgi:predicted methyltransferase